MRLTLILSLLSIFVQSQTSSRYPSLLWKISGNGLKKPSYLYGTMHVSNRVAWHLSDEFFDALKSAEQVGLETNPAEWLDNMEKTGELAEISRPKQNGNFQSNFYQNIFRQNIPDKKILKAVISYDPDIINGLLYRQSRSQENFEENTYIDLFIFQAASKLNKTVISLENFEEAEISARLSAVPDEDNESNRRTLGYYSAAQKIEDAYRDGNLDLLDSLSKLSSSRNAQKYLIGERNRAFVRTIDSVIRTTSLFSGVGAAHLPGEDGVIELLRKKGYTVQPLKSRNSKKAAGEKDKISGMMKPLSFSSTSAPDSSFSVELPGRLYPIFESPSLRYYIHPDMVNGHFYTVVRLRHLGQLSGQSRKDILLKVDSLLFENIPGKIISKASLKCPANMEGFEVLSRTARGNLQRYHFYFNSAEMLIFKLGAQGAYASGKEASKFFNSIKIRAEKPGLVNFTPQAGGFSIQLPAQYTYFSDNAANGRGLVEDLQAISNGGNQMIAVQHAVYNDFNYLEEDSFELRRLASAIAENLKFDQGGEYTLTTDNKLPSIRFKAANTYKARLDGKIIIKGVHYYLVYMVTAPGEQPDFSSFNSFTLHEFKYMHPMKTITDNDMFFSVTDEVTQDAASRFNEQYNLRYKAAFSKQETKNDDKSFKSLEKLYYSPSANEYVHILFEKYDEYDYRDPKETEKKIDETFRNESGMILADRFSTYSGGAFTYSCNLKDTATSRAIKVKVHMKNSLMHQVSASYDTIIGLQGWTLKFMESFTALDSSAGTDIFTNKAEKFFNDVASSDTAVKRRANDAATSVGLHASQLGAFRNFISGPSFAKVESSSRAQLLVNGGTLRDNSLIEPYSKLYSQYADSFYLQLCILKGLAYMHTLESAKAFEQLITKEPPLIGDESLAGNVFSVFYDSLELCPSMFPGLMKLTVYEEFKGAVYALLAEMVSKKMIRAADIQTVVGMIKSDANLTIKRNNTSGKKNREGNAHNDVNDYSSVFDSENLEMDGGYRAVDGTESTSRPLIADLGISLLPFFNSDPQVKLLVGKILKSKESEITIPLTVCMLKWGIRGCDSAVAELARNPLTANRFYAALCKNKLQKYFPEKLNNQQYLLECYVNSRFMRRGEKEKTGSDSLVLVKKLSARNRYQAGDLYVYRHNKPKSSEEIWHAVFVGDSLPVPSAEIEPVYPVFFPDTQKSTSENLNTILQQFSMRYRKRSGS